MWTDASQGGFGAVLEQMDEDSQRYPIAYASRQTNQAEMKYAPTQLEVAAIVFTVEHFEVYLLGNVFTVFTDHQALVSAFLVHFESQSRGLLARWYLRLSRFLPLMTLKYKPGLSNSAADSLSRVPLSNGQATEQNSILLHVMEDTTTGMELVQWQQRQDSDLAKLIDYLKNGKLPLSSGEAQRVIVQGKKGYYVVDDILYYESSEVPGRRRLVVPKHLQERIIDEHYDSCFSGHFAPRRMKQRVSQYYH